MGKCNCRRRAGGIVAQHSWAAASVQYRTPPSNRFPRPPGRSRPSMTYPGSHNISSLHTAMVFPETNTGDDDLRLWLPTPLAFPYSAYCAGATSMSTVVTSDCALVIDVNTTRATRYIPALSAKKDAEHVDTVFKYATESSGFSRSCQM